MLEGIGKVAYQITFPPEVASFHDVFHVSLLKKFRPDLRKILSIEQEVIAKDMNIEIVPM